MPPAAAADALWGQHRAAAVCACSTIPACCPAPLPHSWLLTPTNQLLQAKGVVALIVDAIWCVFWLSCAAALSDMIGWYSGFWGGYYSSSKSRLQAATAFSWLTW